MLELIILVILKEQMLRINGLFDNNYNSKYKSLKYLCPEDFSQFEQLRENLKPYSRKRLYELQEQNPNLIIFPADIQDTKDKIHDSVLYTLENEYGEYPEETEITTSNLMGFFGIDSYEIHIHSRFDEKFRNDNFLHYMLSRVFFPNVVDLPHSTGSDGNLNLLLFAFPVLLNNALKQGLIKEYQTHEYNDPNIRGVIDVQRHIRMNIPFNGKVAYKTREHSRDNFTTQLIRHTIEFIKTTDFGRAILEQDETTKESVSIINEATPSYSRNERQFIINKNLNPKIHPFYSEYTPLQKLCIQILRYECLDFKNENEGLYGIIFDGAWLWEEYLNTILAELNLIHAENKNSSKGIKLFSDRSYWNYPDFYKTGEFILDAKYKKLGRDDNMRITVDSADYHQMITYMRVQDAPVGGFVYPLATEKTKAFTKDDLLIGTLNGELSLPGKVYHFPLQIPQKQFEYNEFVKEINFNENNLLGSISEVISSSK